MAEKRAAQQAAGTAGARAGDRLAGLKALAERAGTGRRGPAPVDQWNPELTGELDMVIRRDGSWHYLGTPIHRKALTDLFSTILRKDEDGRTYLVTPVEKYAITVEDAPFVAVEMFAAGEGKGQTLTFRTNAGDVLEAGREQALRFQVDERDGGIKPYLHVRGRLEALLSRSVAHEVLGLAEICAVNGSRVHAVRSGGVVFVIMAADEVERQVSG